MEMVQVMVMGLVLETDRVSVVVPVGVVVMVMAPIFV